MRLSACARADVRSDAESVERRALDELRAEHAEALAEQQRAHDAAFAKRSSEHVRAEATLKLEIIKLRGQINGALRPIAFD